MLEQVAQQEASYHIIYLYHPTKNETTVSMVNMHAILATYVSVWWQSVNVIVLDNVYINIYSGYPHNLRRVWQRMQAKGYKSSSLDGLTLTSNLILVHTCSYEIYTQLTFIVALLEIILVPGKASRVILAVVQKKYFYCSIYQILSGVPIRVCLSWWLCHQSWKYQCKLYEVFRKSSRPPSRYFLQGLYPLWWHTT